MDKELNRQLRRRDDFVSDTSQVFQKELANLQYWQVESDAELNNLAPAPEETLDERLIKAAEKLSACYAAFDHATATRDSAKVKSARADIEIASAEACALCEQKMQQIAARVP